jgi:hypothetical protein
MTAGDAVMRGETFVSDDGTQIRAVARQNDPRQHDAMWSTLAAAMQNGEPISVSYRGKHDHQQALLGYARSAYLATFEHGAATAGDSAS